MTQKEIKKIAIFSALVAVLFTFIIIGYNKIIKRQNFTKTNELEILPTDASIIVQIENFSYLKKFFLDLDNPLSLLINSNILDELKININKIDSLSNKNKYLNKLVTTNQITISFHNIGYQNNSILITTKISHKINKNQLIRQIQKYSNTTDTSYRKYIDTKIYTIKIKENTYYYCIFNNFFSITTNPLILENQIRQNNNSKNITQDNSFKRIKPYISSGKIKILVNYKNLLNTAEEFFNSRILQKNNINYRYAQWSYFDLSFDKKIINFTGYTTTDDKVFDSYLSIFSNQKAPKSIDLSFMPEKTAEFCTFQISDFSSFLTYYEKYLDSKNLSNKYISQINTFNQKNKIDLTNTFHSYFDNTITFFKVKFNEYSSNYSYFAAIKIKSSNGLKEELQKMIKRNIEQQNKKLDKTKQLSINHFTHIFNVDNSQKVTFFQIPENMSFIYLLFEQLYNFPNDLNFYYITDDYIYFSQSNQELENLYTVLYTNKTMNKIEELQQFINSITKKSNIFYFSNQTFNSPDIHKSLNKKYKEFFQKNNKLFSKYTFISFQITSEKKSFQTQLSIYLNKNYTNIGLSAWEKKIRNNVSQKPTFFTNLQTKEKEILIVDDSNYIYLIDKKGNIIWTRRIKENITSNLYEVDLFKNKKKQIIFSTTKFILTLDRNGEIVKEKCLELPKESTIGASVIDYEEKKDYRIFVPIDNTIYLYDSDLKQISEWKSPQSNTEITSKVFFFNNNQKDYLLFTNKSQIFITDRKGNIRINITKTFQFPTEIKFYFQKQTAKTPAFFITTDASGKVVLIDLKGNTKILDLNTFSANHHFLAQDINNDNILEYIYTDDKTIFVYNIENKLLFSYTFSEPISFGPVVLKFVNGINIGVTIAKESKIYFFDINGNINKNFPITANGPFSVGILNKSDVYNLITNQNNNLINYFLN